MYAYYIERNLKNVINIYLVTYLIQISYINMAFIFICINISYSNVLFDISNLKQTQTGKQKADCQGRDRSSVEIERQEV